MCEYCELVETSLKDINGNGKAYVNQGFTNDRYYFITQTNKGKVKEMYKINYCPMCGRRLSGE